MKFKILMLLFVAACSLAGCSDDDKKDPEAGIRYYVKYEYKVYVDGPGKQHIKCMTEKGEVKMEMNATAWSAVYGPFKKGDDVYMYVDSDYASPADYECYSRLWVSIEKDPFVLKDEVREKGAKQMITAYTIGYNQRK